MRLIGDIGGTKALLALVDEATGSRLATRRLICADYPDFEHLLEDFLSGSGASSGEISGGCLGIAAPLADAGGSVRLTNLPWTLDPQALSRRFRIGRLKLINDLAAAGLGLTAVATSDLVTLQAGAPRDRGVRLVIGAGTGLGMATLIAENDTWTVVPGEGGHVAFAPADDQQVALWSALRSEYGRVEYEHVISGPGLVRLHRFLGGPSDVRDAEALVSQGATDRNAITRKALALFASIFGAFAGDMSLATGARGGVFLTGGIVSGNVPLMQSGVFLAAFNDKGGHRRLTELTPVHIVADPEVGLKGAALHDRKV